MDKDLSAIDQRWILTYCDKYIAIARMMPTNSILRIAAERRIENIMDMLEAYQNRHTPRA